MPNDRATALVYKDGKVLMIHRLRDGNDYYLLPGGHIENGENEESAVLRELKEETSIEATLGKKLCAFTGEDGRRHHVYLCNYVSGVPILSKDSVELAKSSKDNIYIPMWLDISKLESITTWPKETKSFLIEYFRNV